MFEILTFSVTFECLLPCPDKPVGEQDAPVGRGQRVVLPLGEVIVVVEPLIQLLNSRAP